MWASDLSCVGMATAGASDWCLKWTLDVFNQEVGLSHRSQESVLFSLDTFCIYTECCCCSHLLPFQTSCLLNIFPGCIFSAADVVRRDWCVRPHRVCGLQWSWPLGCRYNAGLLLIALTAAVLQCCSSAVHAVIMLISSLIPVKVTQCPRSIRNFHRVFVLFPI